MATKEFEETEEVSYAEVISVKKLPKKHTVYDIQVAERHRFYANGLLCHNCMGKYHPHGDVSLYSSLVNMVNSNVPTMIGLGGWGSLIDPASAMRYTNTMLSTYGTTFLQKEYLAVTPKVPNYDSTLEEPLYLPALLPNIFLNPTSGIGVGIRTEMPAYTPVSSTA